MAEATDVGVDADEPVLEALELEPPGPVLRRVQATTVNLVGVDGGGVGHEFDAWDDPGDDGLDVIPVGLDFDTPGQVCVSGVLERSRGGL